MTVKAKICGLTTKEAILSAIDNGADYIGFVFFHKSPRNITAKKAKELSDIIPPHIKKVGVFVDPTNEYLDDLFKLFKPDYIQCHGSETQERIYDIHMRYSLPVIKAISVRNSDDIVRGKAYSNVSDMVLFDARAPIDSPIPGGNGIAFDWALLKKREFIVPWILSGGINIDNLEEAVKISGAKIVDVSSSIESAPGVKDSDLIAAFLKKVKTL